MGGRAYWPRWYRRLVGEVRRIGPTCWLCGCRGADTLDHVHPVARGGATTLDNLRPAHLACNVARRARPGIAARVRMPSSREW
jgi:5-methylcytosine-specific restriction endonuclease McrA